MNETQDNVLQPGEARVNVTYGGSNGDLPDPVHFDSTDGDIKAWITEAVQHGGIPGIPEDPNADFADFVIDRFDPTEARPYSLISARPKTPFGGLLGERLERLITLVNDLADHISKVAPDSSYWVEDLAPRVDRELGPEAGDAKEDDDE